MYGAPQMPQGWLLLSGLNWQKRLMQAQGKVASDFTGLSLIPQRCFKNVTGLAVKLSALSLYSVYLVQCGLGLVTSVGEGWPDGDSVSVTIEDLLGKVLSCWAHQAHNPPGTSVGGYCPHFMLRKQA